MYTLIKTEKGYRVLKDRVIFLSGMQLRFLYDLHENLVPDLDMVFTYFESLDQVTELIHLELITVRPQRAPGTGEKKLILNDYLYYGVRASVFRAELTDDGYSLLKEVMGTEFFSECMEEMDRCMAENLFRGSL